MLYNMEICWNTITFYNLQYLQYLNKCDGHHFGLFWFCFFGAYYTIITGDNKLLCDYAIITLDYFGYFGAYHTIITGDN